MGRSPNHKSDRKFTPKEDKVTCKKQFPDCPDEPNDGFCKPCPLYVKK